jgi:hypothetical protein
MRIISFDVGMKNLAYCILNISDNAITNPITSTQNSGSISTFSQDSLEQLMKHIHIERWDVIDLRFEPTAVIPAPTPKLTCLNDVKQAKYMYLPVASDTHINGSGSGSGSLDTPKLFCLKCSEKSKYKVPPREILPIKRNPLLLQKKKLDELIDIHKMLYPDHTTNSDDVKKIRKADKIKEIQTILARDYLEPVDELKYTLATCETITNSNNNNNNNQIKKTKTNYTYAHDLDMITYGRNMMKHLDEILYSSQPNSTHLPVDMMIIENQISTIATRMKTLQGMITQYFIMKNVPYIEFISASCKLKLFTDSMVDISKFVDSTTYSDRKKSGIAICRALFNSSESSSTISNTNKHTSWISIFEKHKKKDDLADCFLQGLWRIYLLIG